MARKIDPASIGADTRVFYASGEETYAQRQMRLFYTPTKTTTPAPTAAWAPTAQVKAITSPSMFYVVSKAFAKAMQTGSKAPKGKLYGVFATQGAAEDFMTAERLNDAGASVPVYPGASLYMAIVAQ